MIRAAGCLFTDGIHVLAGYQGGKQPPCISGFGGHCEMDEPVFQTALRETVEELFGVETVSPQLLHQLETGLPPKDSIQQNCYRCFVFDFKDLELLLKTVKDSGLQSSLYSTLPLTVSDLLFQRTVSLPTEIRHLCLLPCLPSLYIDPCFQEDIRISSSSQAENAER
jgi:ADP-ribose pyrophosphatase YjhB (NUDIX family)